MRIALAQGFHGTIQHSGAFPAVLRPDQDTQPRIVLSHGLEGLGRTVVAPVDHDPDGIPLLTGALNRLKDLAAGVVAWNQYQMGRRPLGYRRGWRSHGAVIAPRTGMTGYRCSGARRQSRCPAIRIAARH